MNHEEQRRLALRAIGLAGAALLVGAAGICSRPSSASGAADSKDALAHVVQVQVSGNAGAFSFSVTVRSPDSGCARYADWWEVVSTDGKLLHRRILMHSHVDEQPFTRS